MRHPASKDEAARLDACNQRRAMPRGRIRQSINRFAKAVGIMDQRRDVAKLHARLRKVRNGADQREKIGVVIGHPSTRPAMTDRRDTVSAGHTPLSVLLACSSAVPQPLPQRSEEHTSELQSLMRISYAIFLVNKKIK